MLAHFVVNAISSFLGGLLFGWIPETFVAAILLAITSVVVISAGVVLELKGHKKEVVAVEATPVAE